VTVVHVYCRVCRYVRLVTVPPDEALPDRTPICRCDTLPKVPEFPRRAPDRVVHSVERLPADTFVLWDGAVEQALDTARFNLRTLRPTGPFGDDHLPVDGSFTQYLADVLERMLASVVHDELRERRASNTNPEQRTLAGWTE